MSDTDKEWKPSPNAAKWFYEFKSNVAKALGLPDTRYPGGHDMTDLLDAIYRLRGIDPSGVAPADLSIMQLPKNIGEA